MTSHGWPDDDREVLAIYAVAFWHRLKRLWQWTILTGCLFSAGMSLALASFWPAIGGGTLMAICFWTVYYRMQRFTQTELGLPRDIMRALIRRYDDDPSFAREVNHLLRGWAQVQHPPFRKNLLM